MSIQSRYIPPTHRERVAAASVMLLTAVSVMLAMVTVFSAYGGYFNPDTLPAAALAAMLLPGLVIIDVVAMILLFFMCRKLVWVFVVALALSLPSLVVYCPIHFKRHLTPEQQHRSFTVMTYNIYHMVDFTNKNGNNTVTPPNPSIQVIIDNNPDIVCIQEVGNPATDTYVGFTQAQADTLSRRYPYILYTREAGLMLMSKVPVTRIISLDRLSDTAISAGYRFNINGRLLSLYSVHLQSIGLSPEDKALYHDITDARTSTHEIQKVRSQLFSKLYFAFQERADQARFLRSQVEEHRGNVIVCGDFNDVPGCYALRTIMGDDMHDAFVEAGTGPSVTYRAGRFYFRIDQILYRGAFRAFNTHRVCEGLSDHYPLMTTFVWDEPSIVEENKEIEKPLNQ